MGILIDVDTVLRPQPLPLIDVRSPGEFAQGHIPRARNVPIFDDQERAEIGITYKSDGRQSAVTRGLELVGPKASQMVEDVKAIVAGQDVAVHCWRGGMRSEGFAWLLEKCGFRPQVLRGGYKAFRGAAHANFAEPRKVVILAGQTGAGKTQLLSELAKAGEQVIDLEALAVHRGSAFGGIGQPPQPTVEQFENQLFLQWRDLDPNRPVWIESESQAIGRVFVPPPVWEQMSLAPAVLVEVEREQRVEFLVQEYGGLPTDQLAAAISKIKKRLGGARLQAALTALECHDLHQFTRLALEYYDKAYDNAFQQRPRDMVTQVRLTHSAQVESVEQLCHLGRELAAPTASERGRPIEAES